MLIMPSSFTSTQGLYSFGLGELLEGSIMNSMVVKQNVANTTTVKSFLVITFFTSFGASFVQMLNACLSYENY
jgi:hypothetical protein